MAEAAGAEVGRREGDQVQLSFPLSLQAAEVGVPVVWEAPCKAALVDMQQTLRNREHLGPVGGRNHCGPPSRSGEWEPRGPGHGVQAPATTSLVAEAWPRTALPGRDFITDEREPILSERDLQACVLKKPSGQWTDPRAAPGVAGPVWEYNSKDAARWRAQTAGCQWRGRGGVSTHVAS